MHRSFVRMTALTVVMVLPLLGLSGIASAKPSKAVTKGSSAWCAKHAKNAHCKAGSGSGSGSGGATGGSSPTITVSATPNPLVETGQSEIHAVIQVSTDPSYAGDAVLIDSSQLDGSCSGPIPDGAVNTGPVTGVTFFSISAPGGTPEAPAGFAHSISVVLDDDGNATVIVDASDCAPGSDVIAADLEAAPYLTALTTLVANPPVVTAPGLTGYPNNEVETGDTSGLSGDSDVYAVFYVEDSPVYAEQEVEISSAQLEARCGLGWIWLPGNGGTAVPAVTAPVPGTTMLETATPAKAAETTLDDDGNAVFVFKGASCAAGDSQVIADVLAGTHDTFTFDYNILPPAPTI